MELTATNKPLSVPAAAPVAQTERIVILDSLRGIAILGILLMNIPGFGLPHVATSDLSVLGETGTNFYTWYFIDGVLEGSQRALFSMLFGAGILLFISRIEKRTEGMMAAEYFFRRQLWLLLFGLVNAFILLWFWDILYHYALCGMLLFAFRRLSPKALFISAFICLLFMTARENRNFYQDKAIISKGEALAKMDTTAIKLTPLQNEQFEEMQGFQKRTSLEGKQKVFEKHLTMTRGSFGQAYKIRAEEEGVFGQTFVMYYFLWDILLFMFLGMAFYKTGVLMAQHPAKTYWLLFIIGFGVGLTLSYFRLQPLIKYNFNGYEITKNTAFQFYELSRFFRSLGFFGLVMLLYKSGLFKWLFNLMRPVGQMAFTNYLMQSIICGIIFYGVGFGMFGQLQRYELYYVVGAVWIFQIILSHIWLKYFRFGPFEWAWRSLTYWKVQSMKKKD